MSHSGAHGVPKGHTGSRTPSSETHPPQHSPAVSQPSLSGGVSPLCPYTQACPTQSPYLAPLALLPMPSPPLPTEPRAGKLRQRPGSPQWLAPPASSARDPPNSFPRDPNPNHNNLPSNQPSLPDPLAPPRAPELEPGVTPQWGECWLAVGSSPRWVWTPST